MKENSSYFLAFRLYITEFMPYLSLIKMSRSSLQDQTNIPLIVTTNDGGGTARSSTGTSLDSCSYKAKSCRSFYTKNSSTQQKLNSESHRNKSVPHNLQVDWHVTWDFSREWTHQVHCPGIFMKIYTISTWWW